MQKTKLNKCLIGLNALLFCVSTTTAGADSMIVVRENTTNTKVTQTGNVFDVQTTTTSGLNAFNAFNKFDVNSGTTVNMHLPSGTENLINLIYGQKTNIDGTLNSIKDGTIGGGNIFMLNPNGFLIGGNSTINVGSLALSTPTQDFMDDVLKKKEDAIKSVLGKEGASAISLDKNGLITVKTKNINAKDGVYIKSAKVQISDLVNTGNIDIEGRSITVENNAIITAANKTKDVVIRAKNTSTDYVETGISVGENASISGKNITLEATSNIGVDSVASVDADKSIIIGTHLGEMQVSPFVGVASLKAKTFIDVAKGAKLDAAEDLKLNVFSNVNATSYVGSPLYFSSVIGAIDNTSLITVADGASLIAGKDLELKSLSNNVMSLMAATITGEFFPDDGFALAIGNLDSVNKIDVGNATLKAGDNMNIEALTNKDMSVSTMTFGLPESRSAADIAIALSDVKNIVSVGGEVSAKNIVLNSDIHAVEATNASASSGMGNFTATIVNGVAAPVGNIVSSVAGKILHKGESIQSGKKEVSSPATLKIAGAVTYVESSNTSQAYLKDNSKAAATGDLDIKANIYHNQFNGAAATIAGGTKDKASNGVAGALNIADYNNLTQAFIGKNATVDVDHRLNILSTFKRPVRIVSEGSYFGEVKEAYETGAKDSFWEAFMTGLNIDLTVLMQGNPLTAIYKNLANSLTRSAVTIKDDSNQNQRFAGSASVALQEYKNSTTAFIADGAKINQNNAAKAGGRIIDVNALTDSINVNMAGIFDLPFVLGTETEGVGIGATVQITDYSNTTGAFIGNGVVMDTEALRVSALNDVTNIEVTGGLGSTGGGSASAMVGYLDIDNTTVSQISGGAQVNVTDKANDLGTYKDYDGKDIDYSKIRLSAKDMSIFVNSAVDASKSSGGAGIAASSVITLADRATQALWGDLNQDLLSSTALGHLDTMLTYDGKKLMDLTTTGNASGFLNTAKDMDITADARGVNVSVAVSVGVQTNKAPEPAGEADEKDVNVNTGDGKDVFKSDAKSDKSSFAVGVAASYAHNDFNNKTAAYVNNARSSGMKDLKLDAFNNIGNYAVTGGVSASTKKADSSVVAGASASYNSVDNATLAFMNNVQIDRLNALNLLAQNDSKYLAVSIGAALATGAQGGATLNGAVNVNEIQNATKSYLNGTTILSSSLVDLTALDHSWLWQIGTGVSISQNTGAGGVVGWNTADNETTTEITDNSAVTSSGSVSMTAKNEMDINSVVTGGGASKKAQVALTGAYNDIKHKTGNKIDKSTVNANVNMTAANESSILSVATGAGVGKKLGASVVVGVNRVKNTTENEINQATVKGSLSALAASQGKIKSFANSVGAGQSAGIGSVGTYNDTRNMTQNVIDQSNLSGQNLKANAVDTSYILAETTGVGVAKSAGLGLAVGVNRINNQTNTLINNSNIQMAGDVSLTALNQPSSAEPDELPDDVKEITTDAKRSITTIVVGAGVAASGSGLGAGLSGVYSDVHNTAKAKITGGTTTANKLSLTAKDASDILTVAVAGGAGGSVGLGGVTATNIIENTIDASIENATVDAKDDVALSGTSDANILSAAVGGAGASNAAAVVNVNYNKIANNVLSGIKQTKLTGKKAFTANAKSDDNLSFYYGAGSGSSGFASNGIVGVNEISGNTSAFVQDSTLQTTADATVQADSTTTLGEKSNPVIVGSVAGSGTAAIGASVMVNMIENTTSAAVENGALKVGGNLGVKATNKDQVGAVVATGGFAGSAGIAGNVVVNSIDSAVEAKIVSDKTKNAQGSDIAVSANNIDVSADNTTEVFESMTTIGVAGTVGFGASIDVANLQGTSKAYIKGNMPVSAQKDVNVNASSTKKNEGIIIAGGGAGTVGLSGTVSVANIGHGEYNFSEYTEGNRADENGNTGINSMLAEKTADGSVGFADLGMGADKDSTDNQMGEVKAPDSGTKSETKSTLAEIDLSGNRLSAQNGSVNVGAKETIENKQIVGGINGAGFVSAGASVAVANIDNNAFASIKNAQIYVGKNVNVKSELDQGVENIATVGGGAAYVSIQGGVSTVTANNVTEAGLGSGVKIHRAKDVLVKANAVSDISNYVASISGALGSLGASVSTTIKEGTTSAFLGEGVEVAQSSGDSVNNVTVLAENNASDRADAYGLSGGVVSAQGAVSVAKNSDKIVAGIGKNSKLNLNNNLSVRTNGLQNAEANSKGFNVGAGAVGASVATSYLSLDNTVDLGEGVIVNANNVELASNQQEAESLASSVAGTGALIGVNASVASSDVKGQVATTLNKGAKLKAKNAVKLGSNSFSNSVADNTGINAGALAMGATISLADSNLKTQTILADNQNIDADNIALTAKANTKVQAENVAGSGGIIALTGSDGATSNDSQVIVKVGKNSQLNSDSLQVAAEQDLNQNAFADSVSVSAGGFTGDGVSNTSNSKVAVEFDTNAKAYVNDVDVTALNKFTKADGGDNLTITGGGLLLSGMTPNSSTDLTNVTTVDFKSGSSIEANKAKQKVASKPNYEMKINALNAVDAHDQIKVDAGGAVNVSGVKSNITDNSTAKITVDNAKLSSVNDMILNANGNVNMSADVAVSMYGAASAIGSDVFAGTTQNNTISILNGGRVLSTGNLYANAGQARGEKSEKFNISALSQIWNKTLIPITDNDAKAGLITNNLINIDGASAAQSQADIFLTSQRNNAQLNGQAITNTIYTGDNQGNSDDIKMSMKNSKYDRVNTNNSSVQIDGSVRAGISNSKDFAIDKAGNVTINGSAEEAKDFYYKKTVNLYQEMVDQLAYLQQMLIDYGSDSQNKAYYEAEISALTNKMKSMGIIGEGNTLRKDVAADYIIFDDINASAGQIELTSDKISGSGDIAVSGGAQITIDNKSKYFLELNDLKLKNNQDSQIVFNHKTVSGASDLTGFGGNLDLNAGAIKSDLIQVSSTYGENGRGPVIDIKGNIENYTGNIIIENKYGSIYSSGAVRGKEIQLKSGGDIVQNVGDFIYHVGGEPSSSWYDTAKNHRDGTETGSVNEDRGNYRSSLVASNNIYISGRYLDLNGLIQSGTSDWNLNINNDNLKLSVGGATKDIAAAKANYTAKVKSDPTASSLYELASDYGNVKAYYNVLTNQIEIDDVRVQGGYIELNGRIMNTSSSTGELKVVDGYGRLNVTNNSKYDILLNDVNIGDKIAGQIKITDTNDSGRTTIFTRNGGTITKTENGVKTNITANVDANGISSTKYDVKKGQRYVWLEGIENVEERETIYNSKSFWGMDWIAPDDATIYEGPTTWTKTATPLREGEKIVVSSSGSYYDYSSSNVDLSDWEKVGLDSWTESSGWWIFSVDNVYTRLTEQKGSKTYFEHSIKAENPVKITFQGFEKANLNVLSKSSVLLNGNVNAGNTGALTMTSQNGGIDSKSSQAQLTAKDISLSAKNGIGDKMGVNVALKGGVLTANNSGSGNIDLRSTGSVVFGSIVNDGGNVNLTGLYGISSKDSASIIQGDSITMSADFGAITGANGDALSIQTNTDKGGTLTASASGDINLKQANGDLGVVSVTSQQGNVTLNVPNGSVFDANEEKEENIQTQAQLEQRWADMGLEGLSGAALDEAIKRYEAQKTAEYREYWEIKNAMDANGNFHYSDIQKAAFADAGLSAEAISNLESAKEQRFAELSSYAGVTTSFDGAYQYTASADEQANIANGAGWDRSQLLYSIDAAKLDTTIGTRISIEKPNISANKVVVNAGKGIGRENGTKVLSMDNISNWSDADKLLLAAAERDNVSISEDGKTLTISLREDLDIDADSMILTAGDHVYLGSEQDINIDKVTAGAGKNITISSARGIYNVSSGNDAVISGNDLTLEGADGGIGTDNKFMNVDLTGKINARAKNNIYLASNGALNVDYIYSPQTVHLKASNITDARADELVNIRAKNVNMDAENIGAADNLFEVVLSDEEGTLIYVNASGDIFIKNAEQSDLNISGSAKNAFIGSDVGNVNVRNVTVLNDAVFNMTGGDLGLSDIRINRNASFDLTQGGLTLSNTNIDQDAEFKLSAGDLSLTDTVIGRNASLELDKGNLNMANVKVGAALKAKLLTGAVGSVSDRASVQSDDLDIMANGDIYLNTTSLNGDAAKMGKIVSNNGNIDLTAGNDNIILNSMIAARNGDVQISAKGSIDDEYQDAINGTIQAGSITLSALNGHIGTVDKNIQVDSAVNGTGVVRATAADDIYINEVDGDMTLNNILSTNGNVGISSNGDILADQTSSDHIKAENIRLTAKNGRVGEEENLLVLDVNDNAGKVNVKAKGDIALRKPSMDLRSDYLISDNGKVKLLLSSGRIYVDQLQTPMGIDATMEDGQRVKISIGGVDLENAIKTPVLSRTLKLVNNTDKRKDDGHVLLYRDALGNQLSFSDWIKTILPDIVSQKDDNK